MIDLIRTQAGLWIRWIQQTLPLQGHQQKQPAQHDDQVAESRARKTDVTLSRGIYEADDKDGRSDRVLINEGVH